MRRESIFLSIWLLAGIVLTTGGWLSLNSAGQLATDKNPFAIQRSAYGKLLARLSETTIDRVWHIGVEQVAPHSHDHGDHSHDHGDHSHAHGDHSHDHGDHSHDRSTAEEEVFEYHVAEEEDVFEYNVADGEEELALSEEDRAAKAEGYHCAMCKEMELAQKGVNFTTESPLIPQAKDFLGHLSALKLVRTNPKSMSRAHVNWATRQVESQLLRSYKMDPTHYGAYNSYHLFLTTHDFGGNDATRKQAQVIAQHTIANVLQEDEDPEPWLTAASAALNLHILKTEAYQISGEKIPVELLKEAQANIGHCLAKFAELQQKSEEAGNWEKLSMERQFEITDRFKFATRTYEPFEVMIARAEARSSVSAEGEVAENTPEIED